MPRACVSSPVFHSDLRDQGLILASPYLPQGQELPLFFRTIIVTDVIVDFIFWMDICITFVTARWVIQTFPIVSYVLTEDLAG